MRGEDDVQQHVAAGGGALLRAGLGVEFRPTDVDDALEELGLNPEAAAHDVDDGGVGDERVEGTAGFTLPGRPVFAGVFNARSQTRWCW